LINCLNTYYSTTKNRNMERKVKSLQITLSAMIILAFLAMPFSTYGQAGKTNFAGSWVLNAEKSQMGQGQGQPPQGQPAQGAGQGQRGGFGGGPLTVKQEANLLTQVRTRTGQDGTATTTETNVTLDGKETVNTTQRGESKLTGTWSADGKSLTIVTKSSFNGNEMVTTAVWSLTDANTLAIKQTRKNQDGEDVTTTMVYDKK
jgi:hypothetical protein